MNTSNKYYEGHIAEVIYVEKPCKNHPPLVGVRLKCILTVNGVSKLYYKFLPYSYSYKESQIKEYLVSIGLPIRNKKKTIEENLQGMPILATLDMFQCISKIKIKR